MMSFRRASFSGTGVASGMLPKGEAGHGRLRHAIDAVQLGHYLVEMRGRGEQ
jgi:hypothetical protein